MTRAKASPLEDYRYLEWETLSEPLDVKGIQQKGDLPDGVETIRIGRDDDYELTGTYAGRAPHPSHVLDVERPDGRQFSSGFTVMAEDMAFARRSKDVMSANGVELITSIVEAKSISTESWSSTAFAAYSPRANPIGSPNGTSTVR